MSPITDATLPLSVASVFTGLLPAVKTGLTIVVPAISNLKSLVSNHLNTDGTLPLLLKSYSHLTHLLLDVLWDTLVIGNTIESIIVLMCVVKTVIHRLVILSPRKRLLLLGIGELIESLGQSEIILCHLVWDAGATGNGLSIFYLFN